MKEKIDKRIIQTVSFFLYSGYYIGLSSLFAFGLSSLSKFYSIPLRIFLVIIMLYYLKRNFIIIQNNIYQIVICIAFAILYTFKVLYTENLGASISRFWGEYIFYLITYCVVPFIFYMYVDFKKHKENIINPMILSGIIVAALNVYLFKDILLSGGIGRLSDISRNTDEAVISPLALAYSSAITISLIIYRLVYEKITVYRKLLLIGGMLLSSIIFFMGSTRGALLAILISILIIFYFSKAKKKIYISLLLAICIPIFIFISEFTGSSLFQRTTSAIEDGDTSGREGLWREALEEFYKFPFLGGRIEVSGIYPHNFILEILMATGIVGLFLFLILFIKSIKNGIKSIKIEKIYLVTFILLGCGFAQHFVTGSLYTSITLFSCLGMMCAKK